MKICKIITKPNEKLDQIRVQLCYWLVTIGVNCFVGAIVSYNL